MSLLHGIGMGTDLRGGWWIVAVACAAAVPLAATYRLARLVTDRPTPEPNPPRHRPHRPTWESSDDDLPRPAPHRPHRRRPAGVARADPDQGDRRARAGAAGRHRARTVAGRAPAAVRRPAAAGPRRPARPGRPGPPARARWRGVPVRHQARGAAPRPPAGARGQPERGRAGQQQGCRPRADPAAPRDRRRGRRGPRAARARAARRTARRPSGCRHRDAYRPRGAGRPGAGALARRRAAVRRRPGQGGRRAALRPAEPAGHQLEAGRGRRAPGPADAAEQRRDLGPARPAGAARRAGVRRRRHPRRARARPC